MPELFHFDLSDLEKDLGCIYMERLRFVNSQPVFYDINHIPNINLPRFTSRTFEDKSLFDILRSNYQIEVKGGQQKLRATKADEKIGKLLNIKKGDPVLYLERKLFTNRKALTFTQPSILTLKSMPYMVVFKYWRCVLKEISSMAGAFQRSSSYE